MIPFVRFKISHLFLASWLLLLVSCSNRAVYEEYLAVDENGWNQNDTRSFEFEIQDTLLIYDLYLNIRNTTNYEYSNIYFFISTRFPDGREFSDTVQCFLADYQGKWLGKGLGKIKDNRLLFKRGIRFPASGRYKMSIEQAMREENLKGISDVGIRLEIL